MKITPTLLRWLAIIWTVIMLIGCLTPHEQVPDELATWNDKVLHIAIFALFAGLWRLVGSSIISVVIAGVLFGALIEVLQYFLPINRSADWLDLFADCVGTGIGVLLAQVWRRLFPNYSF
ncbi:VanZ family protein [Spirosoma flavum]|uniref:VanZ family protein n=1 Tax=Spirosoma flavum TaxID=2048557 RepID=A0ABW6AJT4_9BACT